MKIKIIFLCLITLSIFKIDVNAAALKQSKLETIKVSIIDHIPSRDTNILSIGLAGVLSGYINDELVIIGGSNFPELKPWEGGIKKYWKDIYVRKYDKKNNQYSWKVYKDAFPKEIGYGLSFEYMNGIVCVGGCNSEEVSSDVYFLTKHNDKFKFENYPKLPTPMSNMSGALIDSKIYVAGGINRVSNSYTTNCFYVLDLKNLKNGWKSLEPWPGLSRAFSVSMGQNNGSDMCFYLFSGRSFEPNGPWTILEDGYEYNIRLAKWKKLDSDNGPKFPVMAGSGFSIGANHIMFLGGANINYEGEQKDHPGFKNTILQYHIITNTVEEVFVNDFGFPVTTNVLKDNKGNYVLTGGERRPGVRTDEIVQISIERSSYGLATSSIIVLILYFALMTGIGFFFSKRQKNKDDYFKGGGRLPWWAVGLSIFGTALSAITFMAIPAKAYATDWSYMLMNAGIILVAPIIVFLFIPLFRKFNITTAYEYLERRFNLFTRLICSISFILYQVGRMGVILLLPSIALNVVTGVNIMTCIIVMGVLSLIYTMLGGIEAVVWTNVIQIIILLGGALFTIFQVLSVTEGGFAGVISIGMRDAKFAFPSLDFDLRSPSIWTVMLATVFANVTTYGTDQTIVQKYLTTKDVKMSKKSVWMNAALTIPATLIFFFIGTCLYVFFKTHPDMLSSTIENGDAIFPYYIYTQMSGPLIGLLIAGVFAAAMSTLSSSMNSAATAYAVDIHFRFGWSKNVNELKLAKLFTLIIGIIGIAFAIYLATFNIQSLWDEMQKILGLVLGCMGGLFLLGLLTKKANSIGAVVGIFASIIVQFIMAKTQIVHLLLYAVTGFITCFIVGYISSLPFTGKADSINYTIYKYKK